MCSLPADKPWTVLVTPSPMSQPLSSPSSWWRDEYRGLSIIESGQKGRGLFCIFRAFCDRHLPSEELSSLLTATAIISTIKSDSDFRESGTECVLSSTFHQKFTNIFFDRDEGRQNVIFSLLLCCWWGLGLESPWSGNANVKSQVGRTE